MAIIEDIFNVGINALRGQIFAFGELIGEVYAGQFRMDITAEDVKIKPGVRVMTFRDFKRRTRARYARHELLNRTSVLEKVGDEPDTITLEIKLLRELGTNPEEEIERIRDYIKAGYQDALIIGSEVLGEFVITSMEESREYVDCFGRTHVAELSLTFEETGAAEQTETATSTDLPLIWL